MKEYNNLKTINNYARQRNVTSVYIYKLIKAQRMESVKIDGVNFIDVKRFPQIPKTK